MSPAAATVPVSCQQTIGPGVDFAVVDVGKMQQMRSRNGNVRFIALAKARSGKASGTILGNRATSPKRPFLSDST